MKEEYKLYGELEGSPLNVSLAGISYCDGSYRIMRPHSPLTVIEYIIDGEGYVVIDGKPQIVGKDKVYILRKGADQLYYSSSEYPWEKIFINIEGELPLLILEKYGLDGWLFDGDGLKDLFLRIIDIVKRENGTVPEQTELAAIFFEAVARLSRSVSRSTRSIEAIKLKDYIDQNNSRIISNNELASVIFRSTDYTLKLFKREYGTTPYKYQLSEKLETAKRLLRDTALPIGAISESLGYSDACYFSGLFKSRFGICPREYRKNL